MSQTTAPVKDRRKELVRIAYNQIAQKGFEGLRIHEVATEAGINNATLHYYFPSKEELIRGVVDLLIQQFSASFFSDSSERDQPDAWELILYDFKDARNRPQQAPQQLIVYSELMLRAIHDPGIAEAFQKLDESWRGFLAGVIKKGIEEGAFRAELEPKTAATLLMIQIKGMGLQILGEPNREITDQVFEQLTLLTKSWLSVRIERG